MDESAESAGSTERLRRLEACAARIEQRLIRIETQLECTQRSCTNMDEHINFVENVYTAVRQPLSFLASKFRANPLPLQCSRHRPESVCSPDNELEPSVRSCAEVHETESPNGHCPGR